MRQDAAAPADGSAFGWLHDGTVTALILFYEGDGEGWSLCPRAGVPESQWPPYAGDDEAFGERVLEGLGTGSVVDLGPLIGETRNCIFRAPVAAELGCGIIAVKVDLPPVPDAFVFPRGRYVHYPVLRRGAGLPSLADLLADRRRLDLGPRFPLASLHGEAG